MLCSPTNQFIFGAIFYLNYGHQICGHKIHILYKPVPNINYEPAQNTKSNWFAATSTTEYRTEVPTYSNPVINCIIFNRIWKQPILLQNPIDDSILNSWKCIYTRHRWQRASFVTQKSWVRIRSGQKFSCLVRIGIHSRHPSKLRSN